MFGMLKNMIFGGNVQSQDPNASKFVNDSLKLQGLLTVKEKSKPFRQLAEECTVTMAVLDEKNFNYVLNVENNDGKDWERMSFRITKQSQFKTLINSICNECLIWYKDKTFYILELFADDEIVKAREEFYDKLATLICSYDFKTKINQAMNEPTKDSYIMNYGEIEDLNDFLEKNFEIIGEIESKEEIIESMNNLSLQNGIPKKEFIKRFKTYEPMFKIEGIPFIYDIENDELKKLDSENESVLRIVDIGDLDYILVVEKKDSTILVAALIDSESSILIDKNNYGISFFLQKKDGPNSVNNLFKEAAYSFSVKKEFIKDLMNLESIIKRCLYETTCKVGYNNFSQDVKNIVEFNEEDMYEKDDDEDNNTYKNITLGVFDEFNNSKYEEEAKNKVITQGYKYDRTFIVKDDNTVDVFKTNDVDDYNVKLENIASMIPKIKDKEIMISDALMYDRENHLLFKDDINKDTLWQFDINKEKVIEEWKCGENKTPIYDFCHNSKLGQMNGADVIVGISNKNMFNLDGRINNLNKVAGEIKSYSNSPGFNCVTTTGFGGIAVGANNGDIRLYKDVDKRAKSLIPCYGDPIRFLDSTYDGKYLLATCDKYLIFICAVNQMNESGFSTNLGKGKIKPKTLKVSPKDIAKYNLGKQSFTPAKFNVGKNVKEISITTSLGNCIVLWNLNDVKKGILNPCSIKPVNELIINSSAKFEKNQLVVGMPKSLRVQNEKISCD